MISLRSPISTQSFASDSTALVLSDLSLCRRSGVRGQGAGDWLEAQGYALPAMPNQIVSSQQGDLIMSLSHREFWLLQPESGADNMAASSVAVSPGLWPLYCQHSHAWLLLAGDARAEMMAKLCGVDLSEPAFSVGSVAQTQVARVSAVIAHHRRGTEAVFSLFVDQSLAGYLWEVLDDARAEFAV